MEKNKLKTLRRTRRKTGIRKRIFGSPEQPRLSIFRSSKHVYAQVIDDFAGKTLAEASTVSAKLEKGCTTEAAAEVGKAIAEKAKAAGIETVAFDRNGFRYHGRVKALADAAREGGLKF
ncbi:50S ribosomal protein L18 [Algisphaera agarilytica]|uniref:Large ribosomal subunit protein uL18 n=1 Tax=Algisphaera agarilytica TaxID=1385975 RepID=A0A7X0LLI4_9BACT|nr:50S ribosomal protein L18 [Algisphaera agarilytica]MBB6431042.1 large subunit ribosomal protein L18 [Algisphaera agarilytica]